VRKKPIRLSIWTSSREPDRRLYLALVGGLDREPESQERETGFFGDFLPIPSQSNQKLGPDSRIDRSDGNFIHGFSMKPYPDFYSPNIIPALVRTTAFTWKYDRCRILTREIVGTLTPLPKNWGALMVFLASRSYTASYLRPFVGRAFAICMTMTEKSQSHWTQLHQKDPGGLTPVCY
jgi:hypothetical protein